MFLISEILKNMFDALLPFWWVFAIVIVIKIVSICLKYSNSNKGSVVVDFFNHVLPENYRILNKGERGERAVAGRLRDGLPDEYRILNDVYLPLPDGTTTQIDHIVVSQFGIFVIETKTYAGWIFGDEKSPQWTQTIYDKKSKFQNPIRQNYKHICALSETLGIDKSYFFGIVAFAGDCEFKSEMAENVLYSKNVASYIRHFVKPMILVKQLDEIISVIEEWQASIGEERKAQHVENLKKRHAPATLGRVPLCPYCGGEMVLRKRKNIGTCFYGCKKYPKCRGIVDIK